MQTWLVDVQWVLMEHVTKKPQLFIIVMSSQFHLTQQKPGNSMETGCLPCSLWNILVIYEVVWITLQFRERSNLPYATDIFQERRLVWTCQLTTRRPMGTWSKIIRVRRKTSWQSTIERDPVGTSLSWKDEYQQSVDRGQIFHRLVGRPWPSHSPCELHTFGTQGMSDITT